MTIDVFTLVPHAFGWLTEQRPLAAVLGDELVLRLFNYRQYSPLKAGQVDDEPYGGGAGMVLRVDVAAAADPAALSAFARFAAEAYNTAPSPFGFPLVFGEEVIGVVEFVSRRVRRPDDDETTILRRLQVYWEQTAPLVAHYRERGRLSEVDGTGDAATVYLAWYETQGQDLLVGAYGDVGDLALAGAPSARLLLVGDGRPALAKACACTYFDTAKLALRGAGLSLCTRTAGGRCRPTWAGAHRRRPRSAAASASGAAAAS